VLSGRSMAQILIVRSMLVLKTDLQSLSQQVLLLRRSHTLRLCVIVLCVLREVVEILRVLCPLLLVD
jgi:hypothetical protein